MSPLVDLGDRKYLLFALRIVGDFGATIAIPVALAALVGQKLDAVQGTEYRYTIGALLIAAIATAIMVYRKARSYGKEYEALNKKDD